MPRKLGYLAKYLPDHHRRISSSSTQTQLTSTSCVLMVSSATKTSTMNKTGEKNCLYSCQKHLFKLSVAFGTVPLAIDQQDGNGKCLCEHRWISKPSLINFTIIIIFVGLGWPVYATMKIYASNIFGQIDYFFHVNSSLFRSVLTVIIFAANNIRAPILAKAWNKLHAVMSDTNFQNFEKIKTHGYLTFVFYSTELIGHFLFMYIVSFNVFKFEQPIPWIYVIQQFFSLFIVDLFIGYFSLTCWIVICGLQNITDQVETCLQNFVVCKGQDTYTLQDLRLKHERYCEVIRLLQKSFGVQLLAIICSTTVDFIGGVYCIIGSFEGLFAESVSNITYFLGAIMVCYGFRVVIILYFSELLTNTAKSPAYHLNMLKTLGSTAEFVLEVELFLNKLANFPVEMSCCDILHLSGGFLATAASHIITYVLVLMQFRLGQESTYTTEAVKVISNSTTKTSTK